MRPSFPVGLAIFVLLLGSACGRPSASQDRPAVPAELAGLRPLVEFQGAIAFQSDLDGDNEIYSLTSDGLRKLTDTSWSDEFPKWSPDGKRISFSANPGGRFQIFIMFADGSGVRKVTRSAHDAIEQTWFPDGRKIAFTEQRSLPLGRSYSLWSIDLRTHELERLVPEFRDSAALPEFSPRASLLAFTGHGLQGWDAFVYDLGSRTVTQLTRGGSVCRPHFSPDGRKIAFVSSKADGKGDIWIMNPDGSDQERLTDRPETFDYFPSWSPDGRTIVFASGTEHYPYEGTWSLYLVDVATKKVMALFRSGARDVFPDWRWASGK